MNALISLLYYEGIGFPLTDIPTGTKRHHQFKNHRANQRAAMKQRNKQKHPRSVV